MSRLEKIPVPCIATFLSFMTLGNVYGVMSTEALVLFGSVI